MIIFLTGFMASGKTYTGQRLAELCDLPFVDLDERIEASAGKSITQVFSDDGEAVFRELERDELRKTLSDGRAIVSTGGGAPCFHGGMDWMNAHGITVFLDPPLGVLLERLEHGRGHRPLVKDAVELERNISARLAARRPVYEKAQIHVRPAHPKADVARLLNDYLSSEAGLSLAKGLK